MSAASAEAANDRFPRFGECKDGGSYQYYLEPLLKRRMGRVEDYLHRTSMYIGNLQKRTGCNNNQDRTIAVIISKDVEVMPLDHIILLPFRHRFAIFP